MWPEYQQFSVKQAVAIISGFLYRMQGPIYKKASSYRLTFVDIQNVVMASDLKSVPILMGIFLHNKEKMHGDKAWT